jgi:hypothetical protein
VSVSVRPTSDEARRVALNRLLEQVARLSEQELAPPDFHQQLLRTIQVAFPLVAGVVWETTPQGNLQLACDVELDRLQLEQDDIRKDHDELLRLVGAHLQPAIVGPHGLLGVGENGAARNPWPLEGFIVPIVLDRKLAGLIEIWREPGASVDSPRTCLQFLMTVAGLAGSYTRAHRLRQISGQQEVWLQLEDFTRKIHTTLDAATVSYRVANEGRRLVGCDRLSVTLVAGRRPRVAAVSGVTVIDRRSNLTRRLTALAQAVFKWGEPLSFNGVRDETLPPKVLDALDAYLAESKSQQVVVMPLRVESAPGEDPQPIRSLLIADSFQPEQPADQFFSRVEVVGRHAASALANAVAHQRIPCRWLWQPLTYWQECVGGKARAVTALVALGLALLITALILVQYPLKMEARGQLLPEARRWVFPPVDGHVVRFEVVPGMEVFEGQPLVLMHDANLQMRLVNLAREIEAAEREIQGANARYEAARNNEQERLTIGSERRKQEAIRDLKIQERDRLRALTNADESAPGNFWVRSPADGSILNFDFRENLTGKHVRPSEHLLRVGDQRGAWEVELKVPFKHIGQVLRAFDRSGQQELDVDLMILSDPTQVYRGKLSRDQVAGQAVPDSDDRSETEPTVQVRVRVDGEDIPEEQRLPRDLLLTGSEVHAKIQCGDRALGYSLFHGVWEFVHEKVLFFF